MDKLRNIVILKDLPSNTIEEAFVVLKKNQKVKKFEHIENHNEFKFERNGEEDKDFVIREAELLIQSYLDNYKNNEKGEDNLYKKNRRLKKAVVLLSCSLFLAIIFILL